MHPEKDRKALLDLLFGDVSEYLPTREKLMQTNIGFYFPVEVVGRGSFGMLGKFNVNFYLPT